MRVQFIAKQGKSGNGTSRYASDLAYGVRKLGFDAPLTFPEAGVILQSGAKLAQYMGIDLHTFFASYPPHAPLQPADVYHITTQTMGTLMWTQRFPAPVVVTVLDILPYILRDDPHLNTLSHPVDRLFYRLSLAALKRADLLISISNYTKTTLIDYLGLPADKIRVIYPGVDTEHFRAVDVPASFRERYNLPADRKYILYVGSEDPRKNLLTLLDAFVRVREQYPNAVLLKVGARQFVNEHERMLRRIDELGIADSVRLFSHVSDEDLVLFYNAADVVAMISLYEGFGYPVVEAMACGTPVVIASASSLPELVPDDTLQAAPTDIEGIAHCLIDQLHRPAEPQRWIQHAQQFDLRHTVRQLWNTFEQVRTQHAYTSRG